VLKNFCRPFAAFTLVLVLCQTNQPLQPSQSLHTITGRVKYTDQTPVEGCNVFVSGSNLSAYTDSAGRFTLYSVPSGSYLIQIRSPLGGGMDTLIILSDLAGSSLLLGDLVITDQSYGASLNHITLAFDSAASLVLYPSTDNRYLVAGTRFKTSIYVSDVTDSISVYFDNSLVARDLPVKGVVLVPAVSFTGCDSLLVQLSDTSYRFKLLDRSHLVQDPYSYVCISAGMPILVPDSVVPTTKSYYRTSTGYMRISDPQSEIHDYGLILVNQESDSCYWGANTLGPFRYARNGFVVAKDTVKYSTASISANHGQNGSFRIYIKYLNGPTDSLTSHPIVSIALGTPEMIYGIYLEIVHFYCVRSVRPVPLGQAVLVGTFSIPGLVLTLADSMEVVN
jgi:uncharacterized protein YfaP (DUF2135 family)